MPSPEAMLANGLILSPVDVGHRAVVAREIAGCVQGLQRLLQRPGSTQLCPRQFPRPHPALKIPFCVYSEWRGRYILHWSDAGTMPGSSENGTQKFSPPRVGCLVRLATPEGD